MALYESTFIARQDVSTQELDSVVDNFVEVLKSKGGSLVKKEKWGLRNLAYRVKKNRKGHYVMLAIDAPAVAVNELERQYKLSESVIRYLTIRVDAISNDASPVMKKAEK